MRHVAGIHHRQPRGKARHCLAVMAALAVKKGMQQAVVPRDALRERQRAGRRGILLRVMRSLSAWKRRSGGVRAVSVREKGKTVRRSAMPGWWLQWVLDRHCAMNQTSKIAYRNSWRGAAVKVAGVAVQCSVREVKAVVRARCRNGMRMPRYRARPEVRAIV